MCIMSTPKGVKAKKSLARTMADAQFFAGELAKWGHLLRKLRLNLHASMVELEREHKNTGRKWLPSESFCRSVKMASDAVCKMAAEERAQRAEGEKMTLDAIEAQIELIVSERIVEIGWDEAQKRYGPRPSEPIN